MALNHIKFIKKMLDRYHDACYPTLSDDFIADVVSEVLQAAPDSYFTYDMVQEHPEFCKQCGACCSTIDCQYFNGHVMNMQQGGKHVLNFHFMKLIIRQV